MTSEFQILPQTDRPLGRGNFLAGIGVCLLGVALLVLQYRLKELIVPWYVPALTTLGVLLIFSSVAQRWSVIRILFLILIVVLAGFEWYFVVSFSKLPNYVGPARIGHQFPAFQTTLANGRPFTDKDLQDGTPSVMVFFRGRW